MNVLMFAPPAELLKPGIDDPQPLRHRTGLAMQAAADHFEVSLTTVSRA
ncbi:hypothetical protein LQL77_31980 [Rhodococcus cerastii]|nr:hypothetical protein [Rhodococcus cerastii]